MYYYEYSFPNDAYAICSTEDEECIAFVASIEEAEALVSHLNR